MAHLIAVGIALVHGAAQPGGAANERLVPHPRTTQRAHEGLVVEPRAEERREQPKGGAQVEIDRGPAVLAAGRESVNEVDDRAGNVRRRAAAAPEREQPVWFLDARREEAARPVVLEAAPDERDAVGQQRRSQRVAREPAIIAPFDREAQLAVAIDAPARGQSP